MVGAFTGFTAAAGAAALGLSHPALQLAATVVFALAGTALLGAVIAKWLILPLKNAPRLNILLATLMSYNFV